MKKIKLLLLTWLLCLPVLALAETVEIHEFWMCSPGDVRLPIYPDYSSRIGEGLTKDDFIITYESSSSKVTVEADGTVHIADGVGLLTNFPLNIIYTPKVEGVGVKTVFSGRLRTVEAINEITPEKDFYRVRVGETVGTVVELNGGSTTLVASVAPSNSGVTVDKYSQWGTDSIRVLMTTQAPGTATVTVKAYNGTTGTIEFEVIGPPTQFEFDSDHFTCYTGEDVTLGLDTGNGPYGMEFYYTFNSQIYRDGEVMPNGYYNKMTDIFSAPQPGEYQIVCSYGDVRGETWVTVLDWEDDEETTDRLPGDADGNGVVNLADVTTILDALANGGSVYFSNADVNADGVMNIQDALRILQHLAGWDVTLQ